MYGDIVLVFEYWNECRLVACSRDAHLFELAVIIRENKNSASVALFGALICQGFAYELSKMHRNMLA